MKLFVNQLSSFSDPNLAASDGLVAIGDEMSVARLLEAYSFGIFPWPHEDMPVLWFCPESRGVLDFQEFHISKSLRRGLGRRNFKITFNEAFSQVLSGCAEVARPGQVGTWITDHIRQAYERFHQAGYAHSIECWMEGELVGGIYGVYVAGVFSGESMFYRRDNASKLCLVHLIDALRANGLQWMDIQMVTDHLRLMGGKYISRAQFFKRLKEAKKLAKPLHWPSLS